MTIFSRHGVIYKPRWRNSYSVFRSIQQKQPHLTPGAHRICLCTTFTPGLSQRIQPSQKNTSWVLWFNWELDNFRIPYTQAHMFTCMHTHTHTHTFCSNILNLVIPTSSDLVPLIQGPPLLPSHFPSEFLASWLLQILLRNGKSQISSPLWGLNDLKAGSFLSGFAVVDNDL